MHEQPRRSERNVRSTAARRHRVPLLVGRVGKKQSKQKAAVRSKDTKAELVLRTSLSASGLTYRLHVKDLPGKPDIVFPSCMLAVFCDGDYWHGRNWAERKKKGFRVRAKYWIKKIESNIDRDCRNVTALRGLGWSVLRLWETDILRSPEKAVVKVQRRVANLMRRRRERR